MQHNRTHPTTLASSNISYFWSSNQNMQYATPNNTSIIKFIIFLCVEVRPCSRQHLTTLVASHLSYFCALKLDQTVRVTPKHRYHQIYHALHCRWNQTMQQVKQQQIDIIKFIIILFLKSDHAVSNTEQHRYHQFYHSFGLQIKTCSKQHQTTLASSDISYFWSSKQNMQ